MEKEKTVYAPETENLERIDEKYNILYRLNKDHEREEIVSLTDELEKAKKLMDDGWEKKNVLSYFKLLAPEICLADLTNPLEIEENGGMRKNYAMYAAAKHLERNGILNNLLEKFSNSDYKIINGESIEFQSRIALLEEQKGLKEVLKEEIRKSDFYGFFYEQLGKKHLDGDIEEVNVDVYIGNVESGKFDDLERHYSCIKDISIDENIYGLFDQLPIADKYVLVPHAGFNYLDELSEKVGREKIMLYEKHFSKNGDFWVWKKDFEEENVLIIDKCYSGKTLEWVAEQIEIENGKPLTAGLYPKSSSSMDKMDYMYFVDELYRKKDVDHDKKGWEIQLYKQIAWEKSVEKNRGYKPDKDLLSEKKLC